ncbi:MAG: YbgA family protein, partial [Tepidiphilus sp.]|nr:YbgA family protein [Tepidiphilus sp.]
ATRGTHANVLQHLAGYLRRVLPSEERQELQELIAQYRQGVVPLVAPLVLLRHHLRRYPDPYLAQQVYLEPHPPRLGLRNAL